MRVIFAFIACLIFVSVGFVQAQQRVSPTASDVIYDDDNPSRRLDVYLPENGTPPYPVVMMFHGASSTKQNVVQYVNSFLSEGYAAVNLNYTPLSAQAWQDAFCAAAWVYENADTYAFDTTRIALFGISYGARVVAGMAAINDAALFLDDCSHTLPPDYAFRGVVAIAGGYDADPQRLLNLINPQSTLFSALSADETAALITSLRTLPPHEWRTLDLPDGLRDLLSLFPIYWVDGNEPPHLLIHGLSDSVAPVRESMEYTQILIAHQISVDLLLPRMIGHVPAPYVFDREMAVFLERVFE